MALQRPFVESLRFQVTTTGWGVNNGNLVYVAALQIGENFGKLTKGECRYFRKPSDLGMDSDALLADSGARLKLEYAKAADYCASYFSGVLIRGTQCPRQLSPAIDGVAVGIRYVGNVT